MLFINIVHILSVFNVTNPRYHNGDEVDLSTIQFLPGVVSYPEPFKVTIQPRSSHQKDIIRSASEKDFIEESHASILNSLHLDA